MANSSGKSASFRWELKNFRSQFDNNKDKDIISDTFNMGSVSFALFYNTENRWSGNTYGVILKNLGEKQSAEINLKMWFENEQGQKFYQCLIEKCLFTGIGNRCKFNVQTGYNDWYLLSDIVYNSYKSLYICCEVTDFNDAVPIIDSTQQFHQNMWSMYEQGVHDAIIKVGETEFKILKALFMAQSEFFKNMFTLDFKERETSTGKIEDVSEHTMKQIIKWMYTCQIDDQDSIEDLFEAADKCQIHLLKTRCAKIIINNLDKTNAFRRLILAVAHNDNQLKDAALDQIDKMPKNETVIYLVSPEWNEFVQKTPTIADEVKKAIVEKLEK